VTLPPVVIPACAGMTARVAVRAPDESIIPSQVLADR
jgi:hypothetical protein